MAETRPDLARITFVVLSLAAMLAACLWILRPFIPAIIWATTVVIATWPIMRRVQGHLGNSRALAVTVMSVAILLVFVLPFWLAIGTIVKHSAQIIQWAEDLASAGVPTPPDWVGRVPVIGGGIVEAWNKIGDDGVRELLQKIRPYAGAITQWFARAVGNFGTVLLQFLLTLVIAAIMYAKGETAAAAVRRFGLRLAGSRGEEAVILAAQAIRGVALGVVVTALLQTAVGAFGLIMVGAPFTSVLCALMFMLCIAQLGPALVLIPMVIYLYSTGSPAWATFLLICSLVAILLDNFLRPILIRKGADLPLLLILAGVIGGLIGFGLIGLFLGPTVLAVGYTLLRAWIDEAAPIENA